MAGLGQLGRRHIDQENARLAPHPPAADLLDLDLAPTDLGLLLSGITGGETTTPRDATTPSAGPRRSRPGIAPIFRDNCREGTTRPCASTPSPVHRPMLKQYRPQHVRRNLLVGLICSPPPRSSPAARPAGAPAPRARRPPLPPSTRAFDRHGHFVRGPRVSSDPTDPRSTDPRQADPRPTQHRRVPALTSRAGRPRAATSGMRHHTRGQRSGETRWHADLRRQR